MHSGQSTEYLWGLFCPSHSGNEKDTSDPMKASNQRKAIGTHRHRYDPGKGKPGRFDMCIWLQCIRLQRNTWPSTPLYEGCTYARIYMCICIHTYENCWISRFNPGGEGGKGSGAHTRQRDREREGEGEREGERERRLSKE